MSDIPKDYFLAREKNMPFYEERVNDAILTSQTLLLLRERRHDYVRK
jgi:hypothetical protein